MNKKIIYLSLMTSFALAQNVTLSEIVVSGTGYEINADENLRNIEIIDKSDITQKGYISLTDALTRYNGVSFSNTGLGKNIDMRGQGNDALMAVKVLVDGREINVLDNSHGVTPIDSINLENVERIEIIPGGGSVLYGSGTRGGVINIISKKEFKDSGHIGIKLNTFESRQNGGNLFFGISKKFSQNLGFSLNGNVFNQDGFQYKENSKGFYINPKFYANIGDNSELVLGMNYYENTDVYGGNLTKAALQKDRKTQADSVGKIRTNRPELSLDLHSFLTPKLEYKLHASHQKQKIRYIDNIYPSGGTLIDQTGSGFEDEMTNAKFSSKYNYADSSYLIFGYDFGKHSAKRQSLYAYDVNMGQMGTMSHKMKTIINVEKLTHSIYALDSHKFNDSFTLSAGARYEYAKFSGDRSYSSDMKFSSPHIPSKSSTTLFDIDKINTKNFSAEITPTFTYSDHGRVYAKYERGFISPTPYMLVSKDQATQQYYTSNIDSEKFDTFELGWHDNFSGTIDANLAIFYTTTKDEITYLGNPHASDRGWWKYINVGETQRLGFDLSLKEDFGAFSLRQNVNYVNAEISKGVNKSKKIPNVSDLKISAGVEYAWLPNFTTFANLTYYSDFYSYAKSDINNGELFDRFKKDGYFITDIGANYKFDHLSISGGVKNLFDKKYFDFEDPIGDAYDPADGRSYYLELKYTY